MEHKNLNVSTFLCTTTIILTVRVHIEAVLWVIYTIFTVGFVCPGYVWGVVWFMVHEAALPTAMWWALLSMIHPPEQFAGRVV